MNEKKLIRRALLGDKQAQKECTENGIVLPCPICGKDDCIEVMDCYTAQGDTCECTSYKKNAFTCVCNYLKGGCGTQIGVSKTKFEALKKWNTRPAPPIGRCGECKHAYINFFSASSGTALCRLWTNKAEGVQMVMQQNDFCNYFEPREN